MKSIEDFSDYTEYKSYLRGYYAGLAMQGLISAYKSGLPNAEDLAQNAIFYADKLLKQLEQK